MHKPSVTFIQPVQVNVSCEEQLNPALLTVIFSSSSLAGGGFLFVFWGFSWMGGGLVFRPSCGG